MTCERIAAAMLLSLANLGACTGEIRDGAGGDPAAAGEEANALPAQCRAAIARPTRSPMRRLTRFEYNNTVRDLLGDTSNPASSLPPEEIGNGFGNDADAQSVSSVLAREYGNIAAGVAYRATADETALAKLSSCAASVSAASQDACARAIVRRLGPLAYRRPFAPGEEDELYGLYAPAAAKSTFAAGIATMIEALLQTPEFLYRVEIGGPDPSSPKLLRPTGDEMATRLSYLLWGSMPDDSLRAAAGSGELSTPQGVLVQAARLLEDPRSHAVVRFFFDNLLPIGILTNLERDKRLYPTFSAAIGGLMREETQRFLEYQIFEAQPGSWPSAFTAPYTFVNQPLAAFYGIPGVRGSAFQKASLDATRRLGLLTQAGVMTGTITTNQSNPVLRGSFVANKMLCRKIPLPTDPAILAMVKLPTGVSGATARERFSKHSQQTVCAGCHGQLDPFGFALENFDPVGRWRDDENGVAIDAAITWPGTAETVNGPVELATKLSESEDAQTCFASRWLDYAYGRTMGSGDECTQAALQRAFKKSGYNVKRLLLELTQTDSFLYYRGGI